MAAQAELSLLPARKPYSRARIYAPEACAALLVVGSGTAGLIAHSWPRQMVESWINIHLLFGLLLCGWVMIRYRRRVSQSPCLLPADVRRLSRQLSHSLYCVLYGVIGLKQGISIVSSLWHGGAVDFSLFDESLRHGPDTQVFDLHNDFQLFLMSALVPLVMVRVMAFRLWLRCSNTPQWPTPDNVRMSRILSAPQVAAPTAPSSGRAAHTATSNASTNKIAAM